MIIMFLFCSKTYIFQLARLIICNDNLLCQRSQSHAQPEKAYNNTQSLNYTRTKSGRASKLPISFTNQQGKKNSG